jgi:hypothetical protein
LVRQAVTNFGQRFGAGVVVSADNYPEAGYDDGEIPPTNNR